MIGVITFLNDADQEDRLISQIIRSFGADSQIEFRAVNEKELQNHLEALPKSEARTVLIHDLHEIPHGIRRQLNQRPNLISVSILEMPNLEESSLSKYIARTIQQTNLGEKSLPPRTRDDLIAVTGTSGGCGVSTIALNLAVEISKSKEVCLVDAHPTRKDIAFLLGGKRDRESTKVRANLTVSNGGYSNSAINIADIGAVLDLKSAISDRRKQTRDYLETLQSANSIIFVMQPDNNHMFELENFLDSLANRTCTGKPIFLFNQISNSGRERSIFKRFKARVGDFDSFAIPYDRVSMDKAKAQYCALIDIAPRSKMRKALNQVAQRFIE
jgi:Flp pilus assembly CpaE family ATPase